MIKKFSLLYYYNIITLQKLLPKIIIHLFYKNLIIIFNITIVKKKLFKFIIVFRFILHFKKVNIKSV